MVGGAADPSGHVACPASSRRHEPLDADQQPLNLLIIGNAFFYKGFVCMALKIAGEPRSGVVVAECLGRGCGFERNPFVVHVAVELDVDFGEDDDDARPEP